MGRAANGSEDRDLAVQVAAIARDVAAVTTTVETLAHLVEGVGERLERVSQRAETTASRVGRPDWQAFAFFGTMILGLVGMFGSGYVRDLSRLEQNGQELTSKHASDAVAAAFDRGQASAWHDEIQRRLAALELVSQGKTAR